MCQIETRLTTLYKHNSVLEKCQCGNDSFEFKLVFSRSEQGIKEKFDESIKILELSTFIAETLNQEEFLNVIAVQLRIILCDQFKGKDISLLPQVYPYMKFHPVSQVYLESHNPNDKIIISTNLFDETANKISLEEWLKQEILVLEHENTPITIYDIIKFSANKHGGAHLDTELLSHELFAIALSKDYLLEISKYIIKSTGFDYAADTFNFMLKKCYDLYNVILDS